MTFIPKLSLLGAKIKKKKCAFPRDLQPSFHRSHGGVVESAQQEQGEGHGHWADQGQLKHGFPGPSTIPFGNHFTP